jgi:hypothetical protein
VCKQWQTARIRFDHYKEKLDGECVAMRGGSATAAIGGDDCRDTCCLSSYPAESCQGKGRAKDARTHGESACCAVLCCAVLCCAVLCCAVLCCAVLLIIAAMLLCWHPWVYVVWCGVLQTKQKLAVAQGEFDTLRTQVSRRAVPRCMLYCAVVVVTARVVWWL